VCCVVIFQNAAGKVPQEWQTGLDASVNPIQGSDGEIDIAQNLGRGKFYPGGPTLMTSTYFHKSLAAPSQFSSLMAIRVGSTQDSSDTSTTEITCGKCVPWKYCRGLKHGIQPHDVMPILNKIFHKAFGNLVGNKKAIADQGWFLPICKLLEHSCLSAEINNNNATADVSSCTGLLLSRLSH